MPGTFSQICIHVIFAVKGRDSLIHESWEIEFKEEYLFEWIQ